MIDIDQVKRIESPEINPYTHGQLIFNRVLTPFNGERNEVLIDVII